MGVVVALGLAESMENAILDRMGILLLRSAALHSELGA
jgi:hypothetical protein